jgi:aryl-alcohol dehydrogenase-like predicted oxidoreductase
LGEEKAKRLGPRFLPENFQRNAMLLEKLESIAKQKECTLAQLSLAWILHQGDFFVPIPGTYKVAHLESNAAAADISLTPSELDSMNRIFPPGVVSGGRHAYDRSKELNI